MESELRNIVMLIVFRNHLFIFCGFGVKATFELNSKINARHHLPCWLQIRNTFPLGQRIYFGF